MTSVCQGCGMEEDDEDHLSHLIEVRVPLTGEYWMLCDPCIDDMVDWIEEGAEE